MSISVKAKCLEITKSVLKPMDRKEFIGEKISFQTIENTDESNGITTCIGQRAIDLVIWDEKLQGKYELQKEYTITIS